MGYFTRRGVYPHPCREQPCSIHIASSDKGSAPSKPTRHVTSALRFIVKCSLEQRAVVIYPFDVLPLEPITKRVKGGKRLLDIPFRVESYQSKKLRSLKDNRFCIKTIQCLKKDRFRQAAPTHAVC